jgi:hypothetical protein
VQLGGGNIADLMSQMKAVSGPAPSAPAPARAAAPAGGAPLSLAVSAQSHAYVEPNGSGGGARQRAAASLSLTSEVESVDVGAAAGAGGRPPVSRPKPRSGSNDGVVADGDGGDEEDVEDIEGADVDPSLATRRRESGTDVDAYDSESSITRGLGTSGQVGRSKGGVGVPLADSLKLTAAPGSVPQVIIQTEVVEKPVIVEREVVVEKQVEVGTACALVSMCVACRRVHACERMGASVVDRNDNGALQVVPKALIAAQAALKDYNEAIVLQRNKMGEELEKKEEDLERERVKREEIAQRLAMLQSKVCPRGASGSCCCASGVLIVGRPLCVARRSWDRFG